MSIVLGEGLIFFSCSSVMRCLTRDERRLGEDCVQESVGVFTEGQR